MPIYARVSSKEQEKEGFSIPAQLKLLKEYASANGIAVAQDHIDVETAKQTGRAAFGDMVAYLKAHPSMCMMLVEKTDRLYRNLKDWVTMDELGDFRTGSNVAQIDRVIDLPARQAHALRLVRHAGTRLRHRILASPPVPPFSVSRP